MRLLHAFAFIVLPTLLFSQVEEERRGPRQIENKYAIKFTPTQLIMGELNLGAEFKIAKKASMDIELGPTLSHVGLGGLTKEDFDDTESSVIKEGSFGYFAALGFRYYPFERTQALTRFYVQPQLKYRVYNTWWEEESGAWDPILSKNTQYKFLFNIGWQLWASKSFGFDFYLGGGIGYRQTASYTPLTSYDGAQFNFFWDEKRVNTPQLLINCGIKVAIGG